MFAINVLVLCLVSQTSGAPISGSHLWQGQDCSIDGYTGSGQTKVHRTDDGYYTCCVRKTCAKGTYPKPCGRNDPDPTIHCKECSGDTFMDVRPKSVDFHKCKPKRSCPKQLGLVRKSNGSSIADARCQCDVDRGYYSPKYIEAGGPEYCHGPKRCPAGEDLSLDDGTCMLCQPGTFKRYEGFDRCQLKTHCEYLGFDLDQHGNRTTDSTCKKSPPKAAIDVQAVTPASGIPDDENVNKTTDRLPKTGKESSHTTGTIAGIVVGLIAPICLIGVICLLCCCCRRKKKTVFECVKLSCQKKMRGTRGPESRAQTSVALLPGVEGARATEPRDPASAALLPEAEGARDTEPRDSTSAALAPAANEAPRALDPRDPASITVLYESAQSEEQGAGTSRKQDFTPGRDADQMSNDLVESNAGSAPTTANSEPPTNISQVEANDLEVDAGPEDRNEPFDTAAYQRGPDSAGDDLDDPNTMGAPVCDLTMNPSPVEASRDFVAQAQPAKNDATNSRGQNGKDNGQRNAAQDVNRGQKKTCPNEGAAAASAAADLPQAAHPGQPYHVVTVNNYNNCNIQNGPSPTINQGVAGVPCPPEPAEIPEVVSEDESEVL